MESTLDSIYYRQEKPDLQEPPERAPAGIGVEPLLASELLDGITFFTSGLLHALQVTEDMSEEDKIFSKIFPHLSQEKRYIGIVLIFYLNYFKKKYYRSIQPSYQIVSHDTWKSS